MNRTIVAKLFKESLLHFLLIGGVLFLIYGLMDDRTSLSGGQGGAPAAQ